METTGQFRASQEVLDPEEVIDVNEEAGMAGLEVDQLSSATDGVSQKTTAILRRLLTKMPKAGRTVSDTEVDPDVRQANLEEILEGSVVKEPVYRATGHGVDTDFEVGFALPNEISPHFGTKGQAEALSIREYFDYEMGYTEKVPAEDLFISGAQSPGMQPSMIKGYLNIKNPIVIEEDFGNWQAQNILEKEDLKSELISAMVKSSGGKLKAKNLKEELNSLLSKPYSELLDLTQGYDPSKVPQIEMQIRIRKYDINDKLRSFLKSKGFDGIKYLNTGEDKAAEAYSYIPFDPQQFKAVFSESFDVEDPRVYKVEGGLLSDNMLRVDGSVKSEQGYLGPVQNKDGRTMTEFSIGVEFNGKETEIPTLVPGLSKRELNALKEGTILPSTKRKAISHAKKRMAAGKSPFYQDGE